MGPRPTKALVGYDLFVVPAFVNETKKADSQPYMAENLLLNFLIELSHFPRGCSTAFHAGATHASFPPLTRTPVSFHGKRNNQP